MRDSARELLLHLSRGCLLLAMLIAPWMFGGVEAPIERLLSFGVAAALGCWLIAAVIDLSGPQRESIRLPALMLPLAGGMLLGAVQLMPLSARWTEAPLARGSAAAESEAGADWPIPHVQGLRTPELSRAGALSHYPASTRLDWGHLAIAVAACFVSAMVFRTQRSQVLMYAALAVNGAAIALLGTFEKFGGRAALFKQTAAAGGDSFATFINRNNAAGYLNLCLAGAIGVILWALYDRRERIARVGVTPLSQQGGLGMGQRLAGAWKDMGALQIAALLAGGVIAAGILVTHSRGGILALVGGMAAVAGALMWIRRRFAAAGLLVGVLIAGVAVTVWSGLGASVTERMTSISHEGLDQNGRVLHWRDSLQAARDFPWLGTGLGTYRYVYEPYQHRLAPSWFIHAENQFVEAVVEGGVVGLGLMLLAIVLVFRAAVVLARADATRLSDGIACVGLFALASQVVHALFDFGPYIPANRLALAALCGVVAGRAAQLALRPGSPRWIALPELRPRLAVPALGLILLANCAIGLRELSGGAEVYAARHGLPALTDPGSLDEGSVAQSIDVLSAALEERPADAEGHARLADLYIYRYRVRMYRMLNEGLGEPKAVEAKPRWGLTDVALLHRRANDLYRAGMHAELAKLRSDPIVQAELVAARRHLEMAAAACPILPAINTRLAALEFLDERRPPDGEWYLRKAVLLAPSDPEFLTRAGLLALQGGRRQDAANYWRASLTLSPKQLDTVLAMLGPATDAKTLAAEVLPRSPELVLSVAKTRYRGPQQGADRGVLVAHARALLTSSAESMPEENRLHAEAVIHDLEGDTDGAIASIRQALMLRPTDIEWRFELAQLLKRQGKLEDARDEGRQCARLDPGRNDIRAWLEELTAALHRGTAPDEVPDRG